MMDLLEKDLHNFMTEAIQIFLAPEEEKKHHWFLLGAWSVFLKGTLSKIPEPALRKAAEGNVPINAIFDLMLSVEGASNPEFFAGLDKMLATIHADFQAYEAQNPKENL